MDVQGVDDSGDVTKDGEEDVDEEVGAAAALEEDTDGGEEDGEDDLADVAGWFVSWGFGLKVRVCFNCSSAAELKLKRGSSYLAVKAIMNSWVNELLFRGVIGVLLVKSLLLVDTFWGLYCLEEERKGWRGKGLL